MTALSMRRLRTALAAALIFAALPCVSRAASRRTAHTATLLPRGDILLAGGVDENGAKLITSDLFAASRGNILTTSGNLQVARASHTATLMSNGCVLIVGGNAANTDIVAPVPLISAEVYNPQTGAFTLTGSMTVDARYNHTATLLNDGTVLVCGGQTDAAGTATASCQLYTPTSCTAGTFAAATPLQQGRYNHTAVLLKDGKVWLAGGRNTTASATGGYLVTTERFVPNGGAGTVQSASPMIEARANHTATLMGDGKALVVGGYNQRDVLANKGITESAEIYDPTSNNVAPAAAMSARRQAHATVLSANGEVTVFGGLGNITTTYIQGSALNTSGMTFDSGSGVTSDLSGPVTAPTGTITGGSALLKLDFLLNKAVVGEISDGEIWLSSPAVHADWGMVNFRPASETTPGLGLHINLAGVAVGCRESSDGGLVAGNCGNIRMSVPASTVDQMTGQIVYYRRTGVQSILSANTVGTMDFSPAMIDSTTTNGTLTAASNVTTDLTLPMDKGLIGHKLIGGNVTLSAGSIIRTSVYTVTLNSAALGTIVTPTANVTPDIDGNGELVARVTFTSLVGTIVYNATSGSLTSPNALLASDQVALTVRMTYTMDGADLSGENFDVDVATIVIRKMLFADAETYKPQTNSWLLAPPPGVSSADHRYGHTATLLPNNDKVFAGGRACANATCSAQAAVSGARMGLQLLYTEKNFAATAGAAAQRRALHTSTLLPNGDVLIAGGTNGPSILSDAELFTPSSEVFSPTNGPMRQVRDLHSATLLPNGRVLIAGGFTTNATSTGSTNTAEIYYPDTKLFLQTSPMANARSNHGAVMLPDGRVFVAGGFGTGDVITDTAEIFISTKNIWMSVAPMTGCQRAIHATVQLKNGKILLIGGVNATGPLTSSALYDPATNTWDCAGVTALPTPLRSHTATMLFDGRILVTGGNDGLGEANKSYIYDYQANTWTETDPLPLLEPRFNHTANLLPNGNVMISGGSQRFGNVPSTIETFHINGSSWATGGGTVNGVRFFGGSRAFHTMTLGLNNKMYGIGGSDGVIGGAGVALYTTAEAGYFSATPDAFSKDAPPSFRQAAIATVPTLPFLPASNLTVTGIRFRGGTEASGGGAASANSAFSFPHLVLQQIEGSGGSGSQSNGGFAVDLTTEIFQNSANLATLDTSLTVPLPATSARLPYGWYSLRVGANDIYSDAKMVQVGPPKPTVAPGNISGVAASTVAMTWTWDVVAGVDGYNVYNATTGVFISTIAAAPLMARATFYQTGLEASATTSILVAGYTLSGDGPLTASPTSYTLSTCPVNVTIASVTFSNLLLYWGFNGNSTPGTVYEVTQSSDNFATDVSTPVPALFSLTTNFTIIPNLSANTTYFFRVQAFNLVGIGSPYSNVISTRTRAPVTQPIVAGRATSSIDWAWSDPGSVTNYRVYNATSGVLLATPVLNSWTEVGLGTNTEHSIRVSAVTNAGEGPLSPSASAYTNAATPGVFSPRISQLTTGSFLLNWTNNGNPLPTVYETQLTEFASNGSTVAITTETAAAFTFSIGAGELIPSTLYGYQVVAINGDGLASDSPAVVTGSTWTLPAAPASLTVRETSPTSITIDWSANGNASSATYQVTYTTDNFVTNIATAPGFAFSNKFGGTSALIGSLVTGATYSVRVIASNPFGQLSQFALAVTTRTNNGGAAVGSIQAPLSANMPFLLTGSLGNSRAISIAAPPNTFVNDGLITISPLVPSGKCAVETAVGFAIGISPSYVVQKPINFTFDFTPADLNGIASKHAILMRHDPATNTCVPLPSRIISATKMTAILDHFSEFIVGQMPLATTADTLRLFPNPLYTDRDGASVKIIGVPIGTRIRIFTLRGELVYDTTTTTDVTSWDATNGTGRSIASGVYLVMAEFGGKRKIEKLAVIR